MANDIISSFFSSSTLKIKRVDGAASGNVVRVSRPFVAPDLKTVRVTIQLSAAAMRHMREDGATIVDSKVIQPTSLDIEGYCQDINSLGQVNAILLDRTAVYSITSKGLTFDNMMCDTQQIYQSPDVMSAIPIRMRFRQIPSKSVSPIVVAQSADASIVSRGMNLLSSATKSVNDIYTSIASKF